MNLKELVDVVTAETELPDDQVRKVSLAILEKFADLIDSQINFTSPIINVRAISRPANTEADGKQERPERKFARMTIKPKKTVPFDAR